MTYNLSLPQRAEIICEVMGALTMGEQSASGTTVIVPLVRFVELVMLAIEQAERSVLFDVNASLARRGIPSIGEG